MKTLLIIMAIASLYGCQEKKEEIKVDKATSVKSQSFFVGTYTNKESQGIYKYSLSPDGTLKEIGLVAESSNPSFLAKDITNNYLLAVNENDINGTGTVESYSIERDSLILIDKKPTGGAHPCHISITKNGYVLIANYTGGNVSLLIVDKKGNLSDLLNIQQHQGKGTTERQEGPHAHFSVLDDKTQTIIASDLGTNELWFYELDTLNKKLINTSQSKLKMKIGGGPRHVALHPNGKWIYVLNELVSQVQQVVLKDDGTYEAQMSFSILPANYSEPNTGADIHISSDGKFLYASNRGHNSIAIMAVNDANGALKLIGHESTKGDGPRNFSLSPDEKYVLVANQHTDTIVSYKRNAITGLLTFVDQIKAPTPVCILF